MTQGVRRRDWLTFTRALAARDTASLRACLEQAPLAAADVQWLWQQRLAPYLYHRLRAHALFPLVAEPARSHLQQVGQRVAILDTIEHHETTRVLRALDAQGVETVCMKGVALAHAVYSTPRARLRGDLDLWIRPDDYDAAISTLVALGYHMAHKSERPLAMRVRYGGELQMALERGSHRHLVELQWPAIRGEWVRVTTEIDHEAIWSRRVPLHLDNASSSMMAPEDLLLHLAVHTGVNHQFSIWAAALLDVHLLVARSPGLDWHALVTRAQAWRVSTVTWAVLKIVRDLFGTDVPDTVLERLAPPRWRRALIDQQQLARWILDPIRNQQLSHRRFVVQLLLVDRLPDVARLMSHTLFPSEEWLRLRYGTSTTSELWRERIRHPVRVLLRAEV